MDLSKFGVDTNKVKFIDDKNLQINFKNIKNDFLSKEDERFLPWFLKYQVDNEDQLILTKETKKVLDFFQNFKPGKGLLLAGQAGSGKTTTLTFLGKKYKYEIFEMNASDSRNKKSIDALAGQAIRQKSLFGSEKLILIDEVDGASGRYDRGGVSELAKLVKESKFPVVFTANDIESDKIKPLKKVCTVVDFEQQSEELLEKIGKYILSNEKVEFSDKDLREFISTRNTIDIRGFINDLQASVFNSRFEISENLELRDYKKKIEILLDKIYFSYPEDSYNESFNSDINLDDVFLYLEENTPNVYAKMSLIAAFNEISKADVFRGRIMRWQHWRFLVYINFYLTYALSESKGVNNPQRVKYKKNSRILSKWIYGNKVNSLRPRTKVEKDNDTQLRFLEQLAKKYGRSADRTRKEDLFYFSFKYKNDEKFRTSMDLEFKIDLATKKALLDL